MYRDLEKAKIILDNVNRNNMKLLTILDTLYPKVVREAPHTPVLLNYKERIKEDSIGVGIVGSRRCTQYGKKVAKEAAEKCGALITAEYALKLGRRVYAVPCNIYSHESEGTNKLIENGTAKCYLGQQSLSEFADIPTVIKSAEYKDAQELSNLEYRIISLVRQSVMSIGDIIIKIGENKDYIMETLSIMELKGLISITGLEICTTTHRGL